MKLRKRAKLRQQDLAYGLNKRQATVSDWERGVTVPHLTPSETKTMMELLNCTIDELVLAFDGSGVSESSEASESRQAKGTA
jgi:transcriptional regulator with XRE-family HTH domain